MTIQHKGVRPTDPPADLQQRVADYFGGHYKLIQACEAWFIGAVERATGAKIQSLVYEAWDSDSESTFNLTDVISAPKLTPDEVYAALYPDADEETIDDEVWDDCCDGPLALIKEHAQRTSDRMGTYEITK